jgi:hypothetical protein
MGLGVKDKGSGFRAKDKKQIPYTLYPIPQVVVIRNLQPEIDKP